MKIQTIQQQAFLSETKKTKYEQIPVKDRLKISSAGFIVGSIPTAIYLKNKNLKPLHYWVTVADAGAAVAIFSDIINLLINNPKKVSLNKQNQEELAFKNKETFLAIYTNDKNFKNIDKYQSLLEDEAFCNRLFNNKEVLKASQDAMLELNNQKIIDAKKLNDSETIKNLEKVNNLILKAQEQQIKTSNPSVNENIAFKGIFNFFKSGGESKKNKLKLL